METLQVQSRTANDLHGENERERNEKRSSKFMGVALAAVTAFGSILPSSSTAQDIKIRSCPKGRTQTLYAYKDSNGKTVMGSKCVRSDDSWSSTSESASGKKSSADPDDFTPYYKLLNEMRGKVPGRGITLETADVEYIINNWNTPVFQAKVESFVKELNSELKGGLSKEEEKALRNAYIMSLIIKLADLHYVDRRLSAQLAGAESGWVSNAVGDSGQAKTALQILDGTSRHEAYMINKAGNDPLYDQLAYLHPHSKKLHEAVHYFARMLRLSGECANQSYESIVDGLRQKEYDLALCTARAYGGYNAGPTVEGEDGTDKEMLAIYLTHKPTRQVRRFVRSSNSFVFRLYGPVMKQGGLFSQLLAMRGAPLVAKAVEKAAKRQETLAHREIKRIEREEKRIVAKAKSDRQMAHRDTHALVANMIAKVDAKNTLEAAQVLRSTTTVIRKQTAASGIGQKPIPKQPEPIAEQPKPIKKQPEPAPIKKQPEPTQVAQVPPKKPQPAAGTGTRMASASGGAKPKAAKAAVAGGKASDPLYAALKSDQAALRAELDELRRLASQ